MPVNEWHAIALTHSHPHMPVFIQIAIVAHATLYGKLKKKNIYIYNTIMHVLIIIYIYIYNTIIHI